VTLVQSSGFDHASQKLENRTWGVVYSILPEHSQAVMDKLWHREKVENVAA
jgi:cation transport regulator ChaC